MEVLEHDIKTEPFDLDEDPTTEPSKKVDANKKLLKVDINVENILKKTNVEVVPKRVENIFKIVDENPNLITISTADLQSSDERAFLKSFREQCVLPNLALHCYMCPLIFKNKFNLIAHLNLHKSNSHFCRKYCGLCFDSLEECVYHEYYAHNINDVKCYICNHKFSSERDITNHMQAHQHISSFVCSYCRNWYTSWWQLCDHWQQQRNSCGKLMHNSIKNVASNVDTNIKVYAARFKLKNALKNALNRKPIAVKQLEAPTKELNKNGHTECNKDMQSQQHDLSSIEIKEEETIEQADNYSAKNIYDDAEMNMANLNAKKTNFSTMEMKEKSMQTHNDAILHEVEIEVKEEAIDANLAAAPNKPNSYFSVFSKSNKYNNILPPKTTTPKPLALKRMQHSKQKQKQATTMLGTLKNLRAVKLTSNSKIQNFKMQQLKAEANESINLAKAQIISSTTVAECLRFTSALPAKCLRFTSALPVKSLPSALSLKRAESAISVNEAHTASANVIRQDQIMRSLPPTRTIQRVETTAVRSSQQSSDALQAKVDLSTFNAGVKRLTTKTDDLLYLKQNSTTVKAPIADTNEQNVVKKCNFETNKLPLKTIIETDKEQLLSQSTNNQVLAIETFMESKKVETKEQVSNSINDAVPETLLLPLATIFDPILSSLRKKHLNYRFSWKCMACAGQYEQKHAFRLHLKKRHYYDEQKLNAAFAEVHPFRIARSSTVVYPEMTSLAQEAYRKAIILQDQFDAQKRLVPCPKCNKYCYSNEALQEHLSTICSLQPKNKCPQCGKAFHSLGTLQTHLSIHTGQLPHQCKFCNKRFRTRGQVTVHHRTHTGERPFVCEVCSQSFTHRETLISHISRHIGMKRYKCYGCNKLFICISALTMHRQYRAESCGKLKLNTRAIGPRVHVTRGQVSFEPYVVISSDNKTELNETPNNKESEPSNCSTVV